MWRVARDFSIAALLLIGVAKVWPALWKANLANLPWLPWAPVLAILCTLVCVSLMVTLDLPGTRASEGWRFRAVAGYGISTAFFLTIVFGCYWALVRGPSMDLGYLTEIHLGVSVPFVISDALLHGVFEEIAFRGLVQGLIMRLAGPLIGIGATTILFVGAHLPTVADYRLLPYWAVVSIVLGYVAWKSSSFLPAAVVHGTHNLLAYVVVGSQGLVALTETIAQLSLLTSTLLCGAILAASLVLVAWCSKRLVRAWSGPAKNEARTTRRL